MHKLGVAMLIALILMGVGSALRVISFWWERSFLKRLIYERVDAAFANPQDNAEELLARYKDEKIVIEWTRVVVGAGLMLTGVCIAHFFDLDRMRPPGERRRPIIPVEAVHNQEMRCLLRSSVKLSRNAGTPVEPLAAL